ncbi:MAG: hypothetical protein WC975_07370 [Phycisphaerae bacterium]
MTTISWNQPEKILTNFVYKVADRISGTISSINSGSQRRERDFEVHSAGAITKTTTTEEVDLDDNDWITKTLPRLEKIAHLPENWDGLGSQGTDSSIVQSIIFMLSQLQNSFDVDIIVPYVCPIAGGGIQLEWTLGNKHVELEFIDKDTIAFLTEEMLDSEEKMRSGEISLRNMNEIRTILNWLMTS